MEFPFPIGFENLHVYPIKRGTNLGSKLLELRHMSRPKFFYLGLPNFILT
jgi:hypothetical protein